MLVVGGFVVIMLFGVGVVVIWDWEVVLVLVISEWFLFFSVGFDVYYFEFVICDIVLMLFNWSL